MRRSVRTLLAAVGAVLLVAGAIWIVKRLVAPPSCGDGVTVEHGECIGLTGGDIVTFDNALAGVEHKIFAENRAARTGHPYVSIVFFTPMTTTNSDSITTQSLVEDLEGIYTAQYAVNRMSGQSNGSLQTPQIQILLANPGSREAQWRTVVDQIHNQTAGKHIVAVAGLAPSLALSTDIRSALYADGIPMVGSTITEDSLADISKNQTRVAPSDKDEVSVLYQLAKRKGWLSPHAPVMLVRDINPQEGYPLDLATDFQTIFHSPSLSMEPYNSTYANAFIPVRQDICADRPGLVLFAGRGLQLQSLLAALGNQLCAGLKVTFLSGDDTTQVTQATGTTGQEIVAALSNGVSLYYAGLATSAEWTKDDQHGGGFRNFSATWNNLGLPQADMIDGESMMTYDSILFTTSMIRDAASQSGKATVNAKDVADAMLYMHDVRCVNGASGPLAIDPTTGNAANKALPVQQVLPISGSLRAVLTSLEWAGGSPLARPCGF